jgi:hypothetical protein
MTTIKSSHRKVSVSDLVVDPRVQRREGFDHRRVDRMAADFQPHALGSITCSQRPDGKLVVLDGMHRSEACKQAAYEGLIPAHVYTGLTIEKEAELFLLLNSTKAPSALSKFLARVVMGDEAAVDMTAILAAHGWRVDTNDNAGCLSAVDAMERVYRTGAGALPNGTHPELLDRTLNAITAAWEHDTTSVRGPVLMGVAQLFARFGATVDTKKLVAEMQDTRPGVLVGKAKVLRDVQGGTVSGALAKILVGMHNKKRRANLLPEWVWVR